jgi:hypothetical protein
MFPPFSVVPIRTRPSTDCGASYADELQRACEYWASAMPNCNATVRLESRGAGALASNTLAFTLFDTVFINPARKECHGAASAAPSAFVRLEVWLLATRSPARPPDARVPSGWSGGGAGGQAGAKRPSNKARKRPDQADSS